MAALQLEENEMNRPTETIDTTRRMLLKGAAVLALIGFAGLRFDLTPAFAAANDKYPEDAFKQKNSDDIHRETDDEVVKSVTGAICR